MTEEKKHFDSLPPETEPGTPSTQTTAPSKVAATVSIYFGGFVITIGAALAFILFMLEVENYSPDFSLTGIILVGSMAGGILFIALGRILQVLCEIASNLRTHEEMN